MSEDVMSQVLSHIITTYGPMALPVIGLLFVVKYLMDKDKERETIYKQEMEAERERTRAERKRGDDLQAELLAEARGNAVLGEELKRALQVLVGGKG